MAVHIDAINATQSEPLQHTSAPSSLKATLLALLDSYEAEALTLFTSLEEGQLDAAPSGPESSTGGLISGRPVAALALARLSSLDDVFAQTLKTAREHASLQQEINRRIDIARKRDAQLAQTTRTLHAEKERLGTLLKAGRLELDRAKRAERDPISTASLLSYASSLSRVTSAPPGFRLDKDLPAILAGMTAGPDIQEEDKPVEDGAEGQGGEGTDAKRTAKALALQNPAMPSMPVELPFPDEGAMGAGLLFSLGGREPLSWEAFIASERAATDAAALALGQEEQISAEERAERDRQAYERHQQQQRQQQRMDEDAFDLDLNP